MKKNTHIILIACSVFILDQITKWLAKSFLQTPLDLMLFKLRFATNTGAAFSILRGHNVLLALLGVGLFIALIYVFRQTATSKPGTVGKALLFGGAAGNLLDRIIAGHVIDFIDFGWWPVFNVADIALSVGVILIIFTLVHEK